MERPEATPNLPNEKRSAHGLKVKNTRATRRKRNSQNEDSNMDFPHSVLSDSSWTSDRLHLAYNKANASLHSPAVKHNTKR
jgi:hypothetical protein